MPLALRQRQTVPAHEPPCTQSESAARPVGPTPARHARPASASTKYPRARLAVVSAAARGCLRTCPPQLRPRGDGGRLRASRRACRPHGAPSCPLSSTGSGAPIRPGARRGPARRCARARARESRGDVKGTCVRPALCGLPGRHVRQAGARAPGSALGFPQPLHR